MKVRLSASSLLFIEKMLKVGAGICGLIGFICLCGSAGTSDFYSEIGENVPDYLDIKAFMAAAVFMIVAFVFSYILYSYDFENVGNIENIPVYCEKSILAKGKHNYYFTNQIGKCLDQFYNGSYGVLSVGDWQDSMRNAEEQKGRVIGEYGTVYGDVCIVANAQRTRVDIMFTSHYDSYIRNKSTLAKCVCL